MKKLVLTVICLGLLFGGCTGAITGKQYEKEDVETIYSIGKGAIKVYGSDKSKDTLRPIGNTVEDVYETVTNEGNEIAK